MEYSSLPIMVIMFSKINIYKKRFSLQIVWLRNGQPLGHGSKFAIAQDFGFSTLDIQYTYPEDEGVYQCKAVSNTGEAVSSATLKCHPKGTIFTDTQHEESWRRIQEIEAPKAPIPEMPDAPKQPPHFTTQLQSLGDLYEGQPAHFEATVEPVCEGYNSSFSKIYVSELFLQYFVKNVHHAQMELSMEFAFFRNCRPNGSNCFQRCISLNCF